MFARCSCCSWFLKAPSKITWKQRCFDKIRILVRKAYHEAVEKGPAKTFVFYFTLSEFSLQFLQFYNYFPRASPILCPGEITNSEVVSRFKDGANKDCFDLHVSVILELLTENSFRLSMILKCWASYLLQTYISMCPLSWLPTSHHPLVLVIRCCRFFKTKTVLFFF